MHTQISIARLVFWATLICCQVVTAFYVRSSLLTFLRRYLWIESAAGAGLWILSRTVPAWPYFYCWCVAGLIDQVASAYLLWSIYSRLVGRALPDCQRTYLLKLAVFFSFAFGIYSSGLIRPLVEPVWQFGLVWDHAFWSALCCLVAFVPLYVWLSYSSLKDLRTVFLGFALYAISHAGLFDLLIMRGHAEAMVWISDCIYLACVSLWFLAGRNARAERRPPRTF